MPETIVSTAPVEVLFPLPTWGTPLERILLRLEDGGRPARTPGVVGRHSAGLELRPVDGYVGRHWAGVSA